MKPIKISVITPAYNAEKYIENCIRAIINADYDLKNVEHIIVDDGSNDNTKSICTKWASKYKHIKFYSKPNGNWGSVINYIKNNKLVVGDYTIICDSDDIIKKEAFKLVNEKAGADMIIGDYNYFDGKKIGKYCKTILRPFTTKIVKKCPTDYMNPWLCPHCLYFKTALLYKITDLEEGVMYQDRVLYPKIEILSKTVVYLHKSISLYWSDRPGNTTTSMNSEKGVKSFAYCLNYFEKHQLFELFVLHIVLCKNKDLLLKISKVSSKFNFRNKKLKLKLWPLYMRLYIFVLYYKKAKKFVK